MNPARPALQGLTKLRPWQGLLLPSHPLTKAQPAQHNLTQTRPSSPRAYSSHATAILGLDSLRAGLLARPPQVHPDMMSPTNSSLLDGILGDLLATSSPPTTTTTTLPPGHHLVYFPLRNAPSQLCADGTDPWPCPDPERYPRRLWAGGELANLAAGSAALALDGREARCVERIADVRAKGDNVYVDVQREYRPTAAQESSTATAIVERRTLVFMGPRGADEKEEKEDSRPREEGDVRAPPPPPRSADHAITLIPSRTLLFQYSALSFNAHLLHLDPAWAASVEGHRNTLVHGPLSLTLLLTLLRAHLRPQDGAIDRVGYRHLRPLYADAALRVCVKRVPGKDRGVWDAWIEDADGRVAVRAKVETVGVDPLGD
ncbi:hypothetical protein F4780DRAFT_748771 [Xylariomycetidae sp. FL0641]|nr:hypothetical protein F4780DRAFT_748771 [Xylariomycetidae sp. FL0641]